MAKAQFYRPGANGRILAALIGAIMIEFAAVGLAGFRIAQAVPVAANFVQPPPIDAAVTADPPESPQAEGTPPPPPSATDATPDFMLIQPIPSPEKPSKPVARDAIMHPKPGMISRAITSSSTNTGLTKSRLTNFPRPAYPYEARRAHQTGSGIFLLTFDASGTVSEVVVTRSTGSALLDQVSTATFRRWRCQPGACDKVSVPVTFTLAGAQL